MEMTAKQTIFAELVASGSSLSDAYREAYEAEGMAPETVHSEACRVARNPKVAASIAEMRAELARESGWCRLQAVHRLEAVNSDAMAAILDGDRSAGTVSAFMGSLDRLNKLTGTDKTMSDLDEQMHKMLGF